MRQYSEIITKGFRKEDVNEFYDGPHIPGGFILLSAI